MRLGVKYGLGPLWGLGLDREDRMRVVAFELAQKEVADRQRITAEFAKVRERMAGGAHGR